MARVSLNCTCGWNFFVPGTTPGHEVSCPSCAQPVRIPGRKPGAAVPQSAGEIALEIQRKQSRVKMMIGGAVAAVVIVAVAAALMTGGSPPPEEESPADKRGGSLTGLGSGGPSRAPNRPALQPVEAPPLPPPPPALYTAGQIDEFKREIFANIWLINMRAIISECMRFRDQTNEWAQLQADIALHEAKIKHNLAELAKVGEKVQIEDYFAQGDRITGFAQRDFATITPAERARILNTWVLNWTAGAALEQVFVLRGEKTLKMFLQFPENTKELLMLVRHPGLLAETAAPSEVTTELTVIPSELLKSIDAGFAALPPGYRSFLIPADRKRLEDLTAAKQGSTDDVEWLKSRILTESLQSFQREAEMIRQQIPAIEPKLKENQSADKIIYKNGTVLNGQILQKTETEVKFKTRYGGATIPISEILRIEEGKGAGVEFPPQYAKAKGDLKQLVPLFAWCSDRNLKLEKELVAYNILTLDPTHEKARVAVAMTRPVIGAASAPPPPSRFVVGDSTKAQAVERTIDVIAGDVTSRIQVFNDVVVEMRRRTESLTTTELPVAPSFAAKGVAVMKNPLTFDAKKLAVPDAVEIGTWWSQLAADERRQFAKYYGLWCAFERGRGK